MHRLGKVITMATLLALPMISGGIGQASAAPAPTPTFTISPNPTIGGTTVTFSGTGCLARSTDPKGSVPAVTVTEIDEPITEMQAHATPMADDDGGLTTKPKPDGTWSISLPVPDYVTGEFTFGAVCDGYSWSINYNPVTLKVAYNPNSKAVIAVLDLDGTEQTTLKADSPYQVLGEGFKPGEKVQLVLRSSPVVLDTVVADPDFGFVFTTFTLPAGTPPGAHTLSLQGLVSGKTATLDIVVSGVVATTVITTVTTTAPSSPVTSSAASATTSTTSTLSTSTLSTSTLSTATLSSTGTTTSVISLASTGTPAQSMASLGGLLVLLGAGTLLITGRIGRRPRRH